MFGENSTRNVVNNRQYKTILKLLRHLLIINSKIPGLILQGTPYFVQNDTNILPGDTRRTTSILPVTKFGAKVEA